MSKLEKYTTKELNELKEEGFLEKAPGHLYKINDYKVKLQSHRWFCQDCLNKYPELFMVKDEIWKEAALNKKGFICLNCLEKRLKRHLVLSDFKDSPVNDVYKFGYEIAMREVKDIQLIECRYIKKCKKYSINCKYTCHEYDTYDVKKENK